MEQCVKDWLDRNLQNYLKKHGPDALKKHEIDHIVDWLQSPDSERQRKRLSRVSPADALKLANAWTKKLNKKFEQNKEKQRDEDGIEEIFTFDDDFKIVQLLSKYSYQREGNKMGHCVGGYHGRENFIFSLRDQKNEPHCTIEFDQEEKSIIQIKGKANQEVKPKYHDYIIEFLNNLEYEYIHPHDLENIGCMSFGSYIFKRGDMPKELEINKELNLKKVGVNHTFDKLSINGNLFLEQFNVSKKIANELIVHGDLVIEDCYHLLRVADKLTVVGDVELVECENLKVLAKELDISGLVSIIECDEFRQKLSIPHDIQ